MWILTGILDTLLAILSGILYAGVSTIMVILLLYCVTLLTMIILRVFRIEK